MDCEIMYVSKPSKAISWSFLPNIIPQSPVYNKIFELVCGVAGSPLVKMNTKKFDIPPKSVEQT